MPFLKSNYILFVFVFWQASSNEPLLNVKLQAPFLFGWDDVQGCHLTFVREVLLTLCAPVSSKVVIIILTIIHSEDTVQPEGGPNILTRCSYVKLLEVMWLHKRRRRRMLSKLQTGTHRQYVLRYTTTVHSFHYRPYMFVFLYCMLAADGKSNKN